MTKTPDSRPPRRGPLPDADGARLARDDEPRVLVSDDDADTRDALRMLLEDAGYTVLEAADGVATLEALASSPTPLVVLLDLLMPRVSGFEVLLRIANDATLRSRHAYCVLTAERLTPERVGPRFAELASELGAEVMGKPFELDDLLACVAKQFASLRSRATSKKGPAASRRRAEGGVGA